MTEYVIYEQPPAGRGVCRNESPKTCSAHAVHSFDQACMALSPLRPGQPRSPLNQQHYGPRSASGARAAHTVRWADFPAGQGNDVKAPLSGLCTGRSRLGASNEETLAEVEHPHDDRLAPPTATPAAATRPRLAALAALAVGGHRRPTPIRTAALHFDPRLDNQRVANPGAARLSRPRLAPTR